MSKQKDNALEIAEFIGEFMQAELADGEIGEETLVNLAASLSQRYNLSDKEIDDIIDSLLDDGEGEEGEHEGESGNEGELDFGSLFGEGEFDFDGEGEIEY